MSTLLIIGIAVVLAIIIVILLVSKLIKSFVALLLIVLIAAGAYFGVKYLDNKTNLRKNIPELDTAFTGIEEGQYEDEIEFIQVNYVAKELGISVIYGIDGQNNETIISNLLQQTRNALLDKAIFDKIVAKYAANGVLPGEIHVVFKFDKLDVVEYVAKRTASDDLSKPDELYGTFEKSINFSTPTFKEK